MGGEDDVVGGNTRDDAGHDLGGIGKGVVELVELVASEVGGEGLVSVGEAKGRAGHGGEGASGEVGEAVLCRTRMKEV